MFHSTNLAFGNIFAEATEKTVVKYISKYFAILCKENYEYYNKLLSYINEQLLKEDFRKYMKVLK